ncbi:MAG TPA: protease modulator HflC [Alphaproteobacteria bacterium]|nr:protease modulator HflC [Alphaproteobacteria bacterium]
MITRKPPSAALLFAALILLVTAGNSFFIVTEMDQAIVLQFGQPVRTERTPGFKLKLPFVQDVVSFDRRILNLSPTAEEVLLADQKRLMVDAFLRYRITDPLVFFQRSRNEQAAESQLNTFLQSALRSELAKTTQPEILSPKREEVMQNIHKVLNIQGKRLGVEIVDVRIRGADLPQQVTENVFSLMKSQRAQEAKLIRAEGEQQAVTIRAKAERERTVLLAEAEKQAQILRGEGDEEAIKTFASAFGRDPKFYGFMRSLEAYKKTLASPDATMVISPDNAFLRTLDKGME